MGKAQLNELPIPPAVRKHGDGVELGRIWAAGGNQHVSLASGVWEDPFNWGMMLVDLARHVANAYEQREGRSRAWVLARIKQGFDAEWADPTDEARGRLLD